MGYSRNVYIIAYGRSPLSKSKKGPLAGMHPVDYAAQTLQGVMAKVPQIPLSEIGDVIVGCARPSFQLDKNTARLIAARAGFPNSVPAQTINRFCSSGLQAIATAANAIAAGQEEIMVAGGVEDMTDCFVPYPKEYQNLWIEENFPGGYMAMGETAERVADQYHISRERMDKMAMESHKKAAKAQAEGKLAKSIIPITIPTPDGRLTVFNEDTGIRSDTTLEKLNSLKPCFRENGSVTAATSSQTTDGAAFVVLASEEKVKEYELKPLAKFLGFSVAGCDPTIMGIGPIYAVPKVLKLTGLSMDDMDVIEINEAFASQSLACIDTLNMPMEKVNPYGGAIALGHPMGATGAILTGKALDYLEDNNKKFGLVTMCIGGGMGAAAILERLAE